MGVIPVIPGNPRCLNHVQMYSGPTLSAVHGVCRAFVASLHEMVIAQNAHKRPDGHGASRSVCDN